MVSTDKPIIIIGTGLGGYSLAKELRKIAPLIPIVLITQDEGQFYSKPQLSIALHQDKTPKNLVINHAIDMQSQLKAIIHTRATVLSINSKEQEIIFQKEDKAQTLPYSALVLAVGAKPKAFHLLEGKERNFRINNLQDYEFFIKENDTVDELAIIGSGLVGCEFAHDFTKKTKDIHVISPDPYPLYQLVPRLIGEALQHALEKIGISWHLRTKPIASYHHHNGISVKLENNQEIKAQGILTAIGISPNTHLATEANLDVNQGIRVNAYLESSAKYIYALGDCAEIEGKCHQFIAPLLQSARALAQTLGGNPTAIHFPPMPISLKVSTYPIIVLPPPNRGGYLVHRGA